MNVEISKITISDLIVDAFNSNYNNICCRVKFNKSDDYFKIYKAPLSSNSELFKCYLRVPLADVTHWRKKLQHHRFYAKKVMQCRGLFDRNINDDELLCAQYHPKSLTEVLSLIDMDIIAQTGDLHNETIMYDEFHRQINYKKLFMQHVIGKEIQNFKDLKNWDVINDDCYMYLIYFEFEDNMYGIHYCADPY